MHQQHSSYRCKYTEKQLRDKSGSGLNGRGKKEYIESSHKSPEQVRSLL
jgi:hypothetical protein